MKRIAVVLVGCLGLILMATRPAGAECRLILNVDRTGSMQDPVVGGGQTKCLLAQTMASEILDAYMIGRNYDVTKPSPSAEFDLTYNGACPCKAGGGECTNSIDPEDTANTRLVQVREFDGDGVGTKLVWEGLPIERDAIDGFLPVGQAITFMQTTSGWYNGGPFVDNCPGPSTPLAQSMCRAARVFSPTFPSGAANGSLWLMKTLTDGGENSSQAIGLIAGETEDGMFTGRCRKTTDTGLEWHDRVFPEVNMRSIVPDSELFGTIGGLTLTASAGEPNGEVRGRAPGVAAPGSSLTASDDQEFFAALSEAGGGRFHFIDASTPLSSEVTRVDSDGDGIPDFRDQCVGDCAADFDHDGIPDANDACPLLAEDGHSPFPSDGCPDTDFDGVHDGIDKCPTVPDDHLAPFPHDGCPAAHWSASATPNLPFRGLVCTSQLVLSPTGAASRAKLSIAGSHSSRAGLRGVLFHNLVPSEAFPVGTFSAGAGTFGFTDRRIDVAAGSATGLWTLCDTNGFGASGVLNSWSLHD
jgi:hypothetical protein